MRVYSRPKDVGNLASPANFARFQFHTLFPELSRAIYLDADVVVLGDIAQVWRRLAESKELLVAVPRWVTMLTHGGTVVCQSSPRVVYCIHVFALAGLLRAMVACSQRGCDSCSSRGQHKLYQDQPIKTLHLAPRVPNAVQSVPLLVKT